jgi:hypothetical protein
VIMAANRLLMRRGAVPFSLSGSFETDMDGWNAGTRVTSPPPRTGTESLRIDGTTEKTVNLPLMLGLQITFSLWARQNSFTSRNIELAYRYSGGSDVTLVSSVGVVSSYALYSGSFTVASSDPIIFSAISSGSVYIDDWSIVGVLP